MHDACLQVPLAARAASHKVGGVCVKASQGVVGACSSVGRFTGEQLSRVGHQSMRFVRWVQRPEVTERLETYLGLALVLLTGYASFRMLRCVPALCAGCGRAPCWMPLAVMWAQDGLLPALLVL